MELFRVKVNNKYGFVDKDGNEVCLVSIMKQTTFVKEWQECVTMDITDLLMKQVQKLSHASMGLQETLVMVWHIQRITDSRSTLTRQAAM